MTKKFDYAEIANRVKSELTRRAGQAVQRPERQQQALQRVNEMGRMEPDQNSHEYGTGYVSQQSQSDMHDYIKKYSDDGSNIDDQEPSTATGERRRVARDYDDANDFNYHDGSFEPYSGHKRPADPEDVPDGDV